MMYNDNLDKKRENILLVGFLIAQLFLVIIIVSILRMLPSDKIAKSDYDRQPKVSINGTESISPSLPSGYKENIERTLLDAIKNNKNDININTKALVREDTITTYYFKEDEMNFFSAIIDLPDLGQSYRVFYEYQSEAEKWQPNPYDLLIISCLNKSDNIIYPDFICKDDYGDLIYNKLLMKYLEQIDLDKFSLNLTEADLSTIYITPRDEFYKPEEAQDYIDQAKSIVESFGINPEIFQYNVIDISNPTYTLITSL